MRISDWSSDVCSSDLIAAILVFVGFSWWSASSLATPQADQTTALFGNFSIDRTGYAGVAAVIVLVAALTAVTSHATVRSEERRLGKGCVSTCSSWWSLISSKKKLLTTIHEQ